MTRKPYPSDLTNTQWSILEPLLPPAKPGGHPRTTTMREGINAILYLVRTGCGWRALPHDLPNWSTVWTYFRNWRFTGVWEAMHTTLREAVRSSQGREATPSAAIIDSQSVKTTQRGGERGYDAGKKVKGRTRHLLVDTNGLIVDVLVHPATITDRQGAKLLLEPLKGVFGSSGQRVALQVSWRSGSRRPWAGRLKSSNAPLKAYDMCGDHKESSHLRSRVAVLW